MQWLPWQDATYAAGGAVVWTRVLARRSRPWMRAAAAWSRELAVMFVLYGLWQLAGTLSLARMGGAVDRGREIARIEADLHMPSESTLQRMVLADHWLLRALNVYYVGIHVAVTGACLVWVFARHRDRYPAARNVLAVATAVSLLVALVPVAPPRLIPGLGLVDTGRLVGPTVYPATARPGLDQLSAMPSVHVLWALVVAGAVAHVIPRRGRWLVFVYPAFTTWVVVVTGNHYWADALVALAIFAFAVVVVARWTPHSPGAATGPGRGEVPAPVPGVGSVSGGPADAAAAGAVGVGPP